MSVRVVCPMCSTKINAPDKASAEGKRAKCPKCQTRFSVQENLAIGSNMKAYLIAGAVLAIVVFCVLAMWLT